MTMKIETIEKQLRDAAAKVVSAEEAAYFADLVLVAHLRKAPRINPLENAVADIKVWAEAGSRELEVEADKESVLLLDFHGLAPTLKLKYIHDELERRADSRLESPGVRRVPLRRRHRRLHRSRALQERGFRDVCPDPPPEAG
jgi:hypothetical protein